MDLSDFDYELPQRLIAQQPTQPRDQARLLVLERTTGNIEHRRFVDLSNYLTPGDCLVLNNSRVIPARLRAKRKATGAAIEVLLLSPVDADHDEDPKDHLKDTGREWHCLARPARRVKQGETLTFDGKLEAQVTAVYPDTGERDLCFDRPLRETDLYQIGEIPYPPYIDHPPDDEQSYQTVYAKHSGSAAAPTAGLHFTNRLLETLEQSGIQMAELTLHVGLGTFQPVREDKIEDHDMHREYYHISREAARMMNDTSKRGGKIVAAGTTVTRALESAVAGGMIQHGSAWTNLFIYPGYEYRAVDALITNFHLPKTTLLMMVSAFASRDQILRAYQEAVEQNYRFYSFGDAMLIL